MTTRSEGYRRARGKEAAALAVCEEFFKMVVGYQLRPITDAGENYAAGDFRTPGQATVECKGQPIDPARYPHNWVEVCEVTDNDRHLGGRTALAYLVSGGDESQLASIRVTDRRPGGTQVVFGWPERVSVSMRTLAFADATVYVNPSEGRQWVYVYDCTSLMAYVVAALDRQGLTRGAGNANEDTFGVFIPVANWRWRRNGDHWMWAGAGAEAAAVAWLAELADADLG